MTKYTHIILFGLVLIWSILIGGGIAGVLSAAETPKPSTSETQVAIGTIDPIPERYQTGLKLYLENCGSCHVALPPEILPTQTWQTLLLEPEQHYGQRLEQIQRPFIFIVWNYLRTFSRPLGEDEQAPYRVTESRYFKALHPRVDLPPTLTASGCISCHPGARDYDYRRLTPEWNDKP